MRSKLDRPTLASPGLIPHCWLGILYMEVKINGGLKLFNTEGPSVQRPWGRDSLGIFERQKPEIWVK